MNGLAQPSEDIWTTKPLALVLARGAAAGLIALALPLPALTESNVENTVERFLTRSRATHAYRAWRRLEASGWGQRGWLVAQTVFSPETGFRYDVTAEGGSRSIRARVLRPLLEEERRLIAEGLGESVALSSENYRFTPKGRADGLVIVEMRALRKDKSLINGRVFLTPGDGELVRAEGRLARSPSFWLSRVDVVRSYRRLNGVVVPVSLESTARLRLPGRSTLLMTYHYSEIDHRPVGEAAP
jgi:hypothetical protein